MIGHVRRAPGGFTRGHLDDGAAQGPDVTGPAVTVASEHLGGHEGDGSLQLALELTGHCGLGHHPRCSAEVSYSEVMTGGINQQVRTYIKHCSVIIEVNRS